MNFSLGNNPPQRSFEVGNYTITLVDNYDEIISQISEKRTEQENIVLNSQGLTTEKVEHKEIYGIPVITAVVKCEEPEENSQLDSDFGGESETTGIWDLCLILTYITGRRVFLPEEKQRYSHIKHGEPIVECHEMVSAIQTAWENRKSFSSEIEKRPFWYFLSMKDSSEAQIRLLCGSVSLEIIQSIEYEEEKKELSEPMSKLLEDIKNVIQESGIEKDVKGNLKSAVGRWGSSNAQTKFKLFLEKYGIITKDISDIPLKRVRGVFNMRNGIAHEGVLRKPNWIDSDEFKVRTALFIASAFIPLIVEEYINRKFGITHLTWPAQNMLLLKDYIYKGYWMGENIETGENVEYMVNIDNSMLETFQDLMNQIKNKSDL